MTAASVAIGLAAGSAPAAGAVGNLTAVGNPGTNGSAGHGYTGKHGRGVLDGSGDIDAARADTPSARRSQPSHREALTTREQQGKHRAPAQHHAAAGVHVAQPGRSAAGRDGAARRPSAHSATKSGSRHAPARPFLIYDSVTPQAIPVHKVIATYATGPYGVPASQVAGRGPVVWIDAIGTDPGASALDVEPGDATPAVAAAWVSQKLESQPNAVAVVYTSLSEWPAVQQAVAALPSGMRSHVRWWIADPTGYPHVVPGASATQWYWGQNYDISTALPGF